MPVRNLLHKIDWFSVVFIGVLLVLGGGVAIGVMLHEGQKIILEGEIVTTWTTTGGLGRGTGWTLVDCEDGSRRKVRGIRGVPGETISVKVLP